MMFLNNLAAKRDIFRNYMSFFLQTALDQVNTSIITASRYDTHFGWSKSLK